MPDPNQSEQAPVRIIVEMVSSETVRRLEARDDDLREYVSTLEKRIEGLHRHIYELMETISNLRSKR